MAGFLRGEAAVARHLASRGETVEPRRMGLAVPASFGERWRAGSVDLVWEPRPALVQLYTVLPFDVPEDRRAAVGAAFLTINSALPAGAFILTPLPAFSLAIFLNHDGTVSDEVLERAIGACREAVARHVDAIAAVAVPRQRPAITVGSTRATLGAEERARLAKLVEHDWPVFAPRTAGPLEIHERTQPWFRRHRVLQLTSPAPLPPMALYVLVTPAGDLRILTGHLEALVQLAKQDPPEGLEREEVALAYALEVGTWVSDAEYGELPLERFDDIPWRPTMSAAEQAQARELRARLAAAVEPRRVVSTERGFTVKSWLLSNRRLMSRELHVPPSGQLLRDERVWAEGLGVFPGKVWGMVSGRLVPIG